MSEIEDEKFADEVESGENATKIMKDIRNINSPNARTGKVFEEK